MKRSSSPVATPPPSTPSPSKKTKSTDSSTKKSPIKVSDGSEGGNGVWTAERYAKLSEKVFATAYQHLDKDAFAAEVSAGQCLHLGYVQSSKARADVGAVGRDQGSIIESVDTGKVQFQEEVSGLG